MKKQSKTFIKIFTVVMTIALLWVLFMPRAQAQSTHLKWYRDYQESVEFEGWKKGQPKKRIQEARAAVKQANETSQENRAEARLNRKIKAIKSRIKS